MVTPLLQLLQSDDVAYDIGASIGIHTIFMAKKACEKSRVIAFEPETKSYGALRRNINFNNLSNIAPIKMALSDKVDVLSFYTKKRIGMGSSSLIKSNESNFCQKVKIVPE